MMTCESIVIRVLENWRKPPGGFGIGVGKKYSRHPSMCLLLVSNGLVPRLPLKLSKKCIANVQCKSLLGEDNVYLSTII